MPQILYNKAFEKINDSRTPEKLINHFIKIKKPERFILVLPTGKLVRRYKKVMIKEYYNKHKEPITEPNIMTLENFVRYLFDRIFVKENYQKISDSMRFAIFEIAASRSDLTYYSIDNKKISLSLLEQLSDLIYGIKKDGIKPEDLLYEINQAKSSKKAGENLGIKNKDKLNDIYNIYQSYEKILSDTYFDQAAILNKLINYFKNADEAENQEFEDTIFSDEFTKYNTALNEKFSDIDEILVYGFSEFRGPEVEFLSLFQKVKSAFSIVLDYSENGPLFGNYRETTISLIKEKLNTKSISETRTQEKTYYDHFRENLFKYKLKEKFNTPNNLKIIEAASRVDEVEFILKKVKELIEIEKYKAHDICIVSRSSTTYSNLFRDLSNLHGIPVNISDRFNLSNSPIVISVFSVLDFLKNQLQTSDLYKILDSNYLDFGKDIDVDNIKRVLNQLRILGGIGYNYEVVFLTRLRKKIETLEDKPYEQQKYKKALSDLELVFKKLIPEEKLNTPTEFINYIKEKVIKGLNIHYAVEKAFEQYIIDPLNEDFLGSFINIEEDGRALAAFDEVLNEFLSVIYKVNNEIASKKEISISYRYLYDKLKTVVSASKYQIREREKNTVNITSIEQIRGIPYKVAFLCGAIEGEFPIAYKSDVLMGKELNDSESKHIESERQKFYQFLTNAEGVLKFVEKQVFITYPKFENDKELVRSQFIEKLNYLFEDKINKHTTYEEDEYTKKTMKLITSFWDECEQVEVERPKITPKHKLIKAEIENSLIDEEEKQILESYKNQKYSITALENYISCPYQYFSSKVLSLKEPISESLLLDPLEKGSLFHEILCLFYEKVSRDYNDKFNSIEIGDTSYNLVDISLLDRSELLKILLQVAKDEVEKVEFDLPIFEIEKNQLLEKPETDKPNLLEAWLDRELERIENSDYLPAIYEYSFGMADSEYQIVDIKNDEDDDQISVRGKIDRVEFSKDQSKFRVADYKTKINEQKTSDKKIKEGKSLQIPIYLKAMEDIFAKNNKEYVGNSGIYYSLKYVKKDKKGDSLEVLTGDTKDDIKELKINSINKSIEVKNNIADGIFHVKPDVRGGYKPCDYCDYVKLCRKEEILNI